MNTAVKVRSQYETLYIAEVALTSTRWIKILRSRTRQSSMSPLSLCDTVRGAKVYLVKSTNYRSNNYPKISK